MNLLGARLLVNDRTLNDVNNIRQSNLNKELLNIFKLGVKKIRNKNSNWRVIHLRIFDELVRPSSKLASTPHKKKYKQMLLSNKFNLLQPHSLNKRNKPDQQSIHKLVQYSTHSRPFVPRLEPVCVCLAGPQ